MSAIKYLPLMVIPFILISCGTEEDQPAVQGEAETAAEQLMAVIQPTEGNNASGTVTFTRRNGDVQVHANVNGLSPESSHGFHIHEFGDCSADDATSSGDHYDPENMPHGHPTGVERHHGDLYNLTSDPDGFAMLDYLDPVIVLDSIRGRAVIVHAGQDDYTTQPTGDAGARLGCGVIEESS